MLNTTHLLLLLQLLLVDLSGWYYYSWNFRMRNKCQEVPDQNCWRSSRRSRWVPLARGPAQTSHNRFRTVLWGNSHLRVYCHHCSSLYTTVSNAGLPNFGFLIPTPFTLLAWCHNPNKLTNFLLPIAEVPRKLFDKNT